MSRASFREDGLVALFSKETKQQIARGNVVFDNQREVPARRAAPRVAAGRTCFPLPLTAYEQVSQMVKFGSLAGLTLERYAASQHLR